MSIAYDMTQHYDTPDAALGKNRVQEQRIETTVNGTGLV